MTAGDFEGREWSIGPSPVQARNGSHERPFAGYPKCGLGAIRAFFVGIDRQKLTNSSAKRFWIEVLRVLRGPIITLREGSSHTQPHTPSSHCPTPTRTHPLLTLSHPPTHPPTDHLPTLRQNHSGRMRRGQTAKRRSRNTAGRRPR